MNVFPLALLLTWISSLTVVTRCDGQDGEKDYVWTKCYDELGCVNNTEDWYHPLYRPIKEQPLDRHYIKTTFRFFGKGKDSKHLVKMEPMEASYKHIKLTNFDKKKKTHILIHDFTSTGLAGWIKHAVKSILAANLGNVISVDWTGGAEPPYMLAVQNARVVALELTKLLKVLINEFGMSPDQFHLIGQGVGAHIAGYAAQNVPDIQRITGLDPNGLYFSDMPCFAHLDPQDAKLVDIIYTDVIKGHGQGAGDPFGHLNFYPNGGLTQPGCNASSLYPPLNEITRDSLKQNEVAPGCSHKRAAKYFTASIDEMHDCPFLGYLCSDYGTFNKGECSECQLGHTCAPMGYPAWLIAENMTVPPDAKFFLDTNNEPPFCMYAYKIVITMEPSSGSDAPPEHETDAPVFGMFCATIYSESEDLMFRTNLNMGISQKPFVLNGDNSYLTFQRGPKMHTPNKVLLRFDSEQNSTTVFVTRVTVLPLPKSGKLATPLCGPHEITKFVPHTQEEFTPCRVACKEGSKHRRRRNPINKRPLTSCANYDFEYNNDVAQPVLDDDYYSNR